MKLKNLWGRKKINKNLRFIFVILLAMSAVYIFSILFKVGTINLTNVSGNIFKKLLFNYLKYNTVYVCKVAALVVGVNLYKKEGRIIYEEKCA